MATDVISVSKQSPTDLEILVPDWIRSLRAQNKSPKTIESYTAGAEQFVAFLRENRLTTDVPLVTREHVELFIERLLATRSPATANNRYRALQRLFAYLVDECEIGDSPMAKMKPPKVPEPETAGSSPTSNSSACSTPARGSVSRTVGIWRCSDSLPTPDAWSTSSPV